MRMLIALLMLTLLPFNTLQAAGKDSTWRYATEPVERVAPDGKQYEKFKNDSDYDYYREKLKTPESENFIERALREFLEWLFRKGLNTTAGSPSSITFLIVGLLLLAGLVLILYIYKPSLFFRNKGSGVDYRVEDDTIHGWDFDQLIAGALRDCEYNHAIRWKYLQVLKTLEDKEQIKWNPNKTVIEYSYELKNKEIKEAFKELSWIFLYFRYGNFEASEQHYNEADRLASEIFKALKS